MHPLITNLENLKTSELEVKVNELSRKYFMAANSDVRMQISMMLDSYKEALDTRRRQEYDRMMAERNKDLDKLIKID